MTTIGINFMANKEIERHNRAMEELGLGELKTKEAQIQINAGSLAESIRHNLVSEAQNEYANTTGRINANANAKQAEVAAGRLSLDTYKYETTGRTLDQSNIDRNVASMSESYARSRLADQQTDTERAKTELTQRQVHKTIAETNLAAAKQAKAASDAARNKAALLTQLYEHVNTGLTGSKDGKMSSTLIKGIKYVAGAFY